MAGGVWVSCAVMGGDDEQEGRVSLAYKGVRVKGMLGPSQGRRRRYMKRGVKIVGKEKNCCLRVSKGGSGEEVKRAEEVKEEYVWAI